MRYVSSAEEIMDTQIAGVGAEGEGLHVSKCRSGGSGGRIGEGGLRPGANKVAGFTPERRERNA